MQPRKQLDNGHRDNCAIITGNIIVLFIEPVQGGKVVS
jgi:hypothetical protein